MSKGKPKPRKAGRPAPPPPTLIPHGTEVMLSPKEAAAALGLKPARFNQLVGMGTIPKADGKDWAGKRFWLQSTINRFIQSMVTDRDRDKMN